MPPVTDLKVTVSGKARGVHFQFTLDKSSFEIIQDDIKAIAERVTSSRQKRRKSRAYMKRHKR